MLRCKSCGHVQQMQIVSGPSQADARDWFERSLERNLGSPTMKLKKRNRKKVAFLTSDQLEEQADATATEAMQFLESLRLRQHLFENKTRTARLDRVRSSRTTRTRTKVAGVGRFLKER